MSAGRRMKIEMTRADRKRRQKEPPTLEQQMEELGLPEGDRAEVRRFQGFLADAALPLEDLLDKHGADYLGFTPQEVAAVRSATITRNADGLITIASADNHPAMPKEPS